MKDKRIFKKSPEELQQYLAFKRKCGIVPSKKGKGSYRRRPKHIGRPEQERWKYVVCLLVALPGNAKGYKKL